jgi:hypothetical protein
MCGAVGLHVVAVALRCTVLLYIALSCFATSVSRYVAASPATFNVVSGAAGFRSARSTPPAAAGGKTNQPPDGKTGYSSASCSMTKRLR